MLVSKRHRTQRRWESFGKRPRNNRESGIRCVGERKLRETSRSQGLEAGHWGQSPPSHPGRLRETDVAAGHRQRQWESKLEANKKERFEASHILVTL